jgi:hypothetical protein
VLLHLVAEAAKWHLPAATARRILTTTIEQLRAAVGDDELLADLA